MGIDQRAVTPDELETSVAALGHDRPDDGRYAELAADLRAAVSGEVMFDEYAQVLYATDGSIYQARPAGVVFPVDIEDVRVAVEIVTDHDVPVLPRGAGSSLAGQAVGPGCVVFDFSRYMDGIVNVDPDARRARVQPGVVQDHLDEELADHGLKFAPDPASSNRATIGGGIGNNSTGAHSVRYGITDAYTEELRVVLADGSLIHTREVVLDGEEYEEIVAGDGREAEIYRAVRGLVEDHEDEIADRYPDLKRSVSGYNLNKVVHENDEGDEVINLSKLFVGAEGTLGIVVEATLSLVTVPEETALALYCFEDLIDALQAVPQALEHDVSAVELMDDEVFRLAAGSDMYASYVQPIPDRTKAALMVEFDSELVNDFEAAVADITARFVGEGDAFEVIEAYSADAQADLWKLRKAAIPLLMSLQGDPKPYPFIEDATVPPEVLADYVDNFEDILEAHDTSAAYFAHAGSGTLHIRPILTLKEAEAIEKMHSIAEDVTDLVLKHDGAFSGEHGDGRARTEFNPKMYGNRLWEAFKELKTAFDPEWVMHPGNVVYRDGPDDPGPYSERGVGADMRDNLRYGPQYQSVEPRTAIDFANEGGFSHLVELCNGCGTCRQTDSGTMCPTYRASKEEIQSTRGRANMLRAAISGEIPEEDMYSRRFQEEVLDLCVGCKGCKSDCPTGVDMAKLKAEIKHQYHQEEGSSLRSRAFANVGSLFSLGSTFAPLSNWLVSVPGSRIVMEKVLGVHRDRQLPTFERTTLAEWFDARGGPAVPEDEAETMVVLFPDPYTNYTDPTPGKAAIEVLEAANVHVRIPADVESSGRAAYSMGFLDRAAERASHNAQLLAPYVESGWSVVFVEPSDAVMFQDEYRDFTHTGDDEALQTVSDAAYGILEYVDTAGLEERLSFAETDERLTYHGHCNQKAILKDHHAPRVLRRAGYDVDHLDSGCCGMAGSFGYEREHFELSKAIGRRLFEQIEASDGETVTAPGASCRSQVGDLHADRKPPHPIEKVAERLATEK